MSLENQYRDNKELLAEKPMSSTQLEQELVDMGLVDKKEEAPKNEPIDLAALQQEMSPEAQKAKMAGDQITFVAGNITGAYKALKNIGASAINTIPDLANLEYAALNHFDSWLQEKGITKQDFLPNVTQPFGQIIEPYKINENERFGAAVGGFLTQLGAFGAVSKATGSGFKGVMGGAATAGIIQDPHSERLSDFLKPFEGSPFVPEIVNYLQSKPDDSAAESRFKNMMEGALLDTGVAGIVTGGLAGFKWLKKMWDLNKAAKGAETAATAVKSTEAAATAAKSVAQAEAYVPGRPKTFVQEPMQTSLFSPEEEAKILAEAQNLQPHPDMARLTTEQQSQFPIFKNPQDLPYFGGPADNRRVTDLVSKVPTREVTTSGGLPIKLTAKVRENSGGRVTIFALNPDGSDKIYGSILLARKADGGLTSALTDVQARYRNKGVAGELYRFTQDYIGDIKPSNLRTPMGERLLPSIDQALAHRGEQLSFPGMGTGPTADNVFESTRIGSDTHIMEMWDSRPNIFRGLSLRQIRDKIAEADSYMPGGINYRPQQTRGLETGASQVAERLGAAGRLPPTTDAEVFSAAAEIVGDPKKMTDLLSLPQGTAYTDVQVAALGMELRASHNHIMDLINKNPRTSEEADRLFVELDLAGQYLTKVHGSFYGATSMGGRTLRMANYSFDANIPENLSTFMQSMGGRQTFAERAQALREMLAKDPNSIENAAKLAQETKATWGEAILSMRTTNLLGPVTAIEVGFSNTSQHLLEISARALAARNARKAADKAWALVMKQDIGTKKTPGVQPGDAEELSMHAFAMETAVKAQQKAFMDSLTAEAMSGVKVFLEDINQQGARAFLPSNIAGQTRAEYRPHAMNSAALNIQNRLGATIVDGLGEASRLGAIPLHLVDAYSDAVAFRSEGAFRATYKGMFEKGLVGDSLSAYVNDVLKERPIRPVMPVSPTPQDARDFTVQMDRYKEYQEIWKDIDAYRNKVKLQSTPDTGWGGALYKAVMESDRRVLGVPVLRAMSPFIRAKVNMAQAAVDNLPLFSKYMSPRNKAILESGGVDAELLKARLQIVNGIMAVGAAGGFAGIIASQGSLNPDVRRMQKETGFTPHSFGAVTAIDEAAGKRIGDVGKYGTAGIVAAVAADFGYLAQYYKSGAVDEKWNTSFADAAAFATATLADKLTIDDTIIDVWHDLSHFSQGKVKMDGSGIQKEISNLIPSAATLRAVTKLVDPVKRNTKSDALGAIHTTLLTLQSNIPGLSKGLEPSLDTLGYPIEMKHGFVRLATESDPDILTKNKTLQYLSNLGLTGAFVANSHPEGLGTEEMIIKPMSRNIRLRGTTEDINLTPKEYNEMVMMSLGKESPDKPGKVEAKIMEIIQTTKSDESKKYKIMNLIDAHRNAARAEMVKKYPDIKDRWRQLAKQRAAAFKEAGAPAFSDTVEPQPQDFTGGEE